MDVFIFQADIYCRTCGEELRRERHEYEPVDVDDESSYDSDNYPKGPYGNGGGEADSPQHCAACRVFLENPLTPDGFDYVQERADEAAAAYREAAGVEEGEYSWQDVARYCDEQGRPVLAEWIIYYVSWGG